MVNGESLVPRRTPEPRPGRRILGAAVAAAAVVIAACGAPSYRPLTIAELTGANGWVEFPDFSYRGGLRDGKPHGAGELRYRSGIQVHGTFVAGAAHGPATVTVPGYGRIEGTLQNGHLVRGSAFLADGGEYTGGFREWAPAGPGRFYDPERGWYTGTFADGALQGEGTLFDPRTNTQVTGTFTNGAPSGLAYVAGPEGASGRYFENGRDVTANGRPSAAAAQLGAEAREEARRAESEAASKRTSLEGLSERIDRGRNLHTTAGISAFNEACDLCNGGLEAYVAEDGRVRVRSGTRGCLILEDRNTTREEREASQRAYERRKAETMRACRDWARDIEDPAFPQRLAALREQHRREGEALAAALARKRAADEAAARYQREQAERRWSEEVRRRAAEIEARQRRAAAEQAERLRQERERCRTAGPADCTCLKFRPPPPPPPPGSSRACAA